MLRSSVLLLAFALLLMPSAPAAAGGRYRGPASVLPPPRGPEDVPREPKPLPPDHWVSWWYLNCDALLAARYPPPPLSSADAALVDRVIVPALHKTFANKKLHPYIRSRALIALARAGRGHAEIPTILSGLRDEEQVIRRSAIFALAVLGDRDEAILARLRAIADDTSPRSSERGCALLALGLLRDDSERTWACLLHRLEPAETNEDARLSAIVAMGLVGDAHRASELLGMLAAGRFGTRELSEEERARLAGALGRIGDPRALPVVMRLLTSGNRPPERRAAAIAVGRLIPRAKGAVSKWFSRLPDLQSIPDRAAREFLLIALGRMAPALPPAGRRECRQRLLKVLTGDGDAVERGYAALALGIGFRGDTGIEDRLVKSLDERAWGVQAAAALALGLIGDRREETANRLFRIFSDRDQSPWTRRMAVTALGLLRAAGTAKAVTARLSDREDRPLSVDMAMVMGLTPAKGFPNALLEVFETRWMSLFGLWAAADAVGRTRDFRLLRPLVTILDPATATGWYPDIVRASSAVALGLLGNRRDGDPLAPLSADLNWLPENPVLDEFLTNR